MRAIPLLLFLLLLACREEPELTLFKPLEDYSGRLDSVHFRWLSNEIGDKTLLVSDDSSFSNVLLDTTIDINHFTAVEFRPNTTYFWSVSTRKLKAEAQFTTKDPLDQILPQYDIETSRTRWSRPPGGSETIRYNQQITLTREDERMRVQFAQGRVDRLCRFYDYFDGRYLYGYLPGSSNGTYFYIDAENREIEISSRIGGLGSGTIYRTKFNY